MLKDRLASVGKILDASDLDGFLFLGLPGIRYLCGFTGSDGALVVSRDGSWFLTDSRYTSQASDEVSATGVSQYRTKYDGISDLLREHGLRQVGFEAEEATYAAVEALRGKLGQDCTLVPVTEGVAALRGAKDGTELDTLQEAAGIAAAAFEDVLPTIRPGVTEREVALALEFAMKRRGAEEKSFDIIVASGPRGALPHGVASEKAIAEGELVTIDYGARYRGYHSDETVTLAVGEVSDELRTIYDTVLDAHDRAMEVVSPGVPLREIDALARDLITAAGFGEHFGHGLGHGVGLEVHEFPTLSPRSEAVACEGMVLTIEPGIYIPGLGGVRIEDMVAVTRDGFRLLTQVPKGFRSVVGR